MVRKSTGGIVIGTANGLTLVGKTLSLAAASGSSAGAVTTGAQTLAGAKTLTANLTVPRGWAVVSSDSISITLGQFGITANAAIGVNGVQLGASAGLVSAINSSIPVWLRGNMTDGAAAVGVVSDALNALSTSGAKIHSFRNATVEKASIDKDGKLMVGTGDSTGTPGAATINQPSGKAALAAGTGAAGIVITNSLVTANSHIHITPLDIDATALRYKVAAAPGSFTITTNANTTAIWKFQFLVIN